MGSPEREEPRAEPPKEALIGVDARVK